MSTSDVVRAWKDEDYRLSLSETERALLPAHPAGLVEIEDADLDSAAGGTEIPNTYQTNCTLGWRCISYSFTCKCWSL